MGPERLDRVRTVEAIAAVSTPGRRDAGSIPATRRRSGGRRRRRLARAMPSSPQAGHPLHPMIAGHATGQKQGRYYSDRRSDRRRLRMDHSRAPRRGGESRPLALVPAARKAPASFSPWRAKVSRGLRACCVISTLVDRCPDRRSGLSVLRS